MEAEGSFLDFTDEILAGAGEHAGAIIPRVSMESILAQLTVVSLCEMFAEAPTCDRIARASVHVLVSIALTRLASSFLCIPKASLLAILATLPPREVLALITAPHSLRAPTVSMATTILSTIVPGPTEVTDAHVVRGAGALPVLALDTAGLVAVRPPVSFEAGVALTIVRAWQVDAGGVDVALVEAEAALVNVRAGEVLPLLTNLALTL